eukprot:6531826-Prymnesium_polylepis.1
MDSSGQVPSCSYQASSQGAIPVGIAGTIWGTTLVGTDEERTSAQRHFCTCTLGRPVSARALGLGPDDASMHHPSRALLCRGACLLC